MKISTLAFLSLLMATLAAQAQGTTAKTYFEGRRITGVGVSSSFDVVLVKSDRPRAVVETSTELAPWLNVSLGADGVLSVGFRDDLSRDCFRPGGGRICK